MAAVPLARLLACGRPPEATVAFGRVRQADRGAFRGGALAVAARLREAGAPRWLVDVDDAFACAVAVLGLAAAGAVGVLPPNRQPGTLARLAAETGGVIGPPGGPAARAHAGPVVDPLELAAAEGGEAPALDPEAPLLELHTSGTAGSAKEVPKTLSQLDEVLALEACLGAPLPPETVVFATASPFHLYGLLFRVLWPLSAGRPFCSDTPLHPEELLPRMAEAAASVLVATPAHLRRLAASGGVAPLRGRCVRVFSSGGPLDESTAEAIGRALGEPPVEVFGSTETGGVAVRGGPDPDRRYAPLPGVTLRAEPASGCVRVRSPFVSVGTAAGPGLREVVLGDRVRLDDDGRFVLLGRADRVVKIGEKRLSLPEMESRLRAHPCVQEAALAERTGAGTTRVGAVVVPSARGERALAEEGRRAVVRALGEHLASAFDRVLLPRAWRFVDELPRDARGKTPREALEALLAAGGAEEADGDVGGADGPGDRPRPRVPCVQAESRGEGRLVRDLEVPHDLAHVEGHFEGMPVVPGVVQLGWALDAAAALLGAAPRLVGVEAFKLAEPLRPGERARLEVERCRGGALRFRIACGARVFASGRLLVEAPA